VGGRETTTQEAKKVHGTKKGQAPSRKVRKALPGSSHKKGRGGEKGKSQRKTGGLAAKKKRSDDLMVARKINEETGEELKSELAPRATRKGQKAKES